MALDTMRRIVGKLETLPASAIVDVESVIDGYVAESSLPEETRRAMRDVRNGNVTRCESLEQLFRELEI